ncbi:hypothetical protein [Paenibacillus peoriae]|nr:hypothetical protein [Paenibacillus peoriae]
MSMALNEQWLTYVMEFKYDQKAYLSAILDFIDKYLVAYVLGTNHLYSRR